MLPLLLTLAFAPAETPSWLVWRGPARCGGAEQVRAKAVAYVDPATLDQLSVDVELLPLDDDRVRVELSIESEHGATYRSIEAAGCDALVDAVSLLVVIHADPLSFDLGQPSPPPTGPPAPDQRPTVQRPSNSPGQSTRAPRRPPPEASPAPRRVDAPYPRPPTATRERTRSSDEPRRPLGDGLSGGAVRAGGLAGWGRMPTVDLGIAAAAILTRPRWRLEASALYLAPRSTPADDAGLSARVTLVGGRVLACPTLWSRSDWAIPLCLGIEAGGARGQGRGGSVNRSDWAAWAAGVVGPRVQWRRADSRVGAWVGADVAGAFVRPAFGFADAPPLHQSSGVAVQAMAGLELHFGVTDPGRRRQEGVE